MTRMASMVLTALLLVGLAGTTSWADEPLRKPMDGVANPLVRGKLTVGVIVAVVRESGTTVWSYGTVAEGSKHVPDGNSVFPIGSVTKLFTTLLLSDMAERGRVGLRDPVQGFLPEGTVMRRKGPHPITLEDLACHVSGLPRMPPVMDPRNPYNPYADYWEKDLYTGLRTCEPLRAPGEAYEYSNLGSSLLGHVLGLREKRSFESLLQERILAPLAMDSTSITLSSGQIARLVQGHDLTTTAMPRMDFPVMQGGGSMYSTADDMVRFIRAQLGLDRTPLASAMAQSHRARYPARPGYSIGLGWHVEKDGNVLWHDGATYGSYSFVGLDLKRKVGILWLSNSSLWEMSLVLERLRAMTRGEEVPPLRFPPQARLEPLLLEQYVGEYETEKGTVLAVTLEEGRLHLGARGAASGSVILPSSPTGFFFLDADDITLSFTRGPDGKVTTLVFHVAGEEKKARRVK